VCNKRRRAQAMEIPVQAYMVGLLGVMLSHAIVEHCYLVTE
jgi:hypothetical protein